MNTAAETARAHSNACRHFYSLRREKYRRSSKAIIAETGEKA
jgi:hypothetical protein